MMQLHLTIDAIAIKQLDIKLNYDVISSCKLGNFVCFVNFEDHFLLKSSGVFFFCSLFVSENTCFNFDRLYWLLG